MLSTSCRVGRSASCPPTPLRRVARMDAVEQREARWSERDWRRGFIQGNTGLDCTDCGARIGSRPELADLHRAWHIELESRLAAPPGART